MQQQLRFLSEMCQFGGNDVGVGKKVRRAVELGSYSRCIQGKKLISEAQ